MTPITLSLSIDLRICSDSMWQYYFPIHWVVSNLYTRLAITSCFVWGQQTLGFEPLSSQQLHWPAWLLYIHEHQACCDLHVYGDIVWTILLIQPFSLAFPFYLKVSFKPLWDRHRIIWIVRWSAVLFVFCFMFLFWIMEEILLYTIKIFIASINESRISHRHTVHWYQIFWFHKWLFHILEWPLFISCYSWMYHCLRVAVDRTVWSWHPCPLPLWLVTVYITNLFLPHHPPGLLMYM